MISVLPFREIEVEEDAPAMSRTPVLLLMSSKYAAVRNELFSIW